MIIHKRAFYVSYKVFYMTGSVGTARQAGDKHSFKLQLINHAEGPLGGRSGYCSILPDGFS